MRNTSAYTGKPSANGLNGLFATMNIDQGTSTDFEICLLDPTTSEPSTQAEVVLSFFDFDNGVLGLKEQMTIGGYTNSYLHTEQCVVLPEHLAAGDHNYENDLPSSLANSKDAVMCQNDQTGSFYTNYPCTEIATTNASDGRTEFTSTVRGFGCVRRARALEPRCDTTPSQNPSAALAPGPRRTTEL